MDLSAYDPAAVLAALYNAAQPVNLGFLDYDPKRMTVDEARGVLLATRNFPDYVKGRPIKVNLRNMANVDLFSYDRDQGGPGAGERAIKAAMGVK